MNTESESRGNVTIATAISEVSMRLLANAFAALSRGDNAAQWAAARREQFLRQVFYKVLAEETAELRSLVDLAGKQLEASAEDCLRERKRADNLEEEASVLQSQLNRYTTQMDTIIEAEREQAIPAYVRLKERVNDAEHDRELAVMALYEISKSTEDDEGGKWPTSDAQHAKVTLHKLKCWPVFSKNMQSSGAPNS